MTYGPVTVVTGTQTCSTMDWKVTTDSNGTHHVRNGTVRTDRPTIRASVVPTLLPRPVGFDLWGDPDAGRFSLVQWGTVRLENAGGAWEGQLSGVASLPGRGDTS